MMELKVNGQIHKVNIGLQTPLLWVLRDTLGLKGTKFGCGATICGACTVHIDGEPARSCSIPVEDCAGKLVTTIEGLAAQGELHPVQKAWIDEQVPQCGYCQPGFIMAAAALLSQKPQPSDEEITTSITNICRCGTYPRIRRAIQRASAAR
jgi:isoquinoline 1-oxidoreductase subunit alpha